MLTDKDFLDFLNDETLNNLSEEKISKIIDEELEKPEEEMDAELIEYCLNKLNKLDDKMSNKEEKKGKGDSNGGFVKPKIKKYIVIAAAIALFLIGSLSVSAFVFEMNLFDGIVELYNDYIRVNFDKTDTKSNNYELLGTELAKKLADNDFSDILLPEMVFNEEFKITKTEYEFTEVLNGATIMFKYKNKFGNINISKYATEDTVSDVEFPNATSTIEKLEVSSISVYCFMQNDYAVVTYRNGLTIYFIQVPMTLDEAIEFAKTIK